ncbi:sugar phosphate isomerase/epimerase family protein [Companilactobacillus jidongensis]|uniref:sugar phosphate isomerase/epimerase family protein n=1 Tax=Companilactobacillus jidongensis TaxID=2486006 RepID=UPI000F76CC2C|nr:TIM barrel protein [Companilactobacillus jidongensis]
MHVSVNTAIFLNEVQTGKSQLECLETLSGSPIDNIEVRGELFKKETKDKELSEIAELCQNNNWKFFYSIPEQLFNTNEVNSNLEKYLKMADDHHICQLKISMGDSEDISDTQLKNLTNLLNKYQVKVTIENQPNEDGTINKFDKQLKKLKDAQVPLGYTFDSGNWYWISECPSNAFDKFKNEITVFHLKDIKDKETVMLGDGATDWKSLLRSLNTDIPVFLEYDIPSDKLNDQIEQVNTILNDRNSH